MKIFAFSDLHGNQAMLKKIVARLQTAAPDVLAFAGDLTNFGDRDSATDLLHELRAVAPANSFVIHGNCDPAGVIGAMQDSGWYLHGAQRTVGDQTWIGYGDVPPTPFGTHNEQDETLIASDLSLLLDPGAMLISHAPAYGINDDIPGRHVGSTAILAAIREFRPRLMIHGHIHEAHALTVYDYAADKSAHYRRFGTAKITETVDLTGDQGLILNVAAAKDGRVTEIDWQEDGRIKVVTELL